MVSWGETTMIAALSDTTVVAIVGVFATVIPAAVSGFFHWRTSSKQASSKDRVDLIDNLQEEIQRISEERDKLQNLINDLRSAVTQIQLDYTRLQVAYVRDIGELETKLVRLERHLGTAENHTETTIHHQFDSESNKGPKP